MVISEYLHVYNFSYHNYLIENINFFYNTYFKESQDRLSKGEANVPFIYNDIWYFLNKKLLQIVKKNYYVSSNTIDSSISIYIQDDKYHNDTSHNHINQNSIVGVFYINPPLKEEGGGLKLHLPIYDNTLTIQPEPNKLYLFPSWMYHIPEPQTSDKKRICLNWGYMSRLRPIHKKTGIMW